MTCHSFIDANSYKKTTFGTISPEHFFFFSQTLGGWLAFKPASSYLVFTFSFIFLVVQNWCTKWPIDLNFKPVLKANYLSEYLNTKWAGFGMLQITSVISFNPYFYAFSCIFPKVGFPPPPPPPQTSANKSLMAKNNLTVEETHACILNNH